MYVVCVSAESIPCYTYHLQNRPTPSRSAERELLRSTNMKVDPRLLGSVESEECGPMYGEAQTVREPSIGDANCMSVKPPTNVTNSPLESSLRSSLLDSSLESYEAPFQISDPQRKYFDALAQGACIRPYGSFSSVRSTIHSAVMLGNQVVFFLLSATGCTLFLSVKQIR